MIIFLKFYLYIQYSQTVLLQNSTYLKKTVQISIKLNLSWITLNNIGVTSWIINMVTSMYQWKILLMIWVVYLITMHPFKKISKYKFKITTKSWITVAFQKSISIKHALFKKVNQVKKPCQEEWTTLTIKILFKSPFNTNEKSKQNYYERFFKNNFNNLKNIWKYIRSLIAIKYSSATNIHMLTHKGETVTDPLHIANIFHDCFSSVTEKN